MTLTVFGAAKGSPGVTTTVMALAARWPDHREPLLVEADPAGGDLVARLAALVTESDTALRERPSTVQLAAASRAGVTDRLLLEYLQRLPGPGEIGALVAPAGPYAAATAIGALCAAGLAGCLGALATFDVLVDVGRVDPGSPALPLVRAADRVVMVVRPSLESVVHTRDLLASLDPASDRVLSVVIGDRPYPPDEVAAAIGVELLGALPDDPVGAAALAGNARSSKVLARAPLMRTAADLASRLAPDLANDAPPATGRAPAPHGERSSGLVAEATR